MREALCLALAKRVGQTITPELATDLVREAVQPIALRPPAELCAPGQMRAKVRALVESMKALPQVDLQVRHHFSEGVVLREITIPAGTVIVGKVHKFTNANILSKGSLTFFLEDGLRKVEAGFHVVSVPGTQRVAFAHEDSVWTTILRTDEVDPVHIEKHFVVDSIEEFLALCESKAVLEGA